MPGSYTDPTGSRQASRTRAGRRILECLAGSWRAFLGESVITAPRSGRLMWIEIFPLVDQPAMVQEPLQDRVGGPGQQASEISDLQAVESRGAIVIPDPQKGLQNQPDGRRHPGNHTRSLVRTCPKSTEEASEHRTGTVILLPC